MCTKFQTKNNICAIILNTNRQPQAYIDEKYLNMIRI